MIKQLFAEHKIQKISVNSLINLHKSINRLCYYYLLMLFTHEHSVHPIIYTILLYNSFLIVRHPELLRYEINNSI